MELSTAGKNLTKDTSFSINTSLNCRGKLLDLSTPKVMGILNATPDSFYDGGKYDNIDSALYRADVIITEGADIIDIGAVSTRPGAKLPDEKTELERILPIVEKVRDKYQDVVISVDTFRSEVAKKAVKAGADIINDVSAGKLDPKMFNVIAEMNVPYIIMHMAGTPENMQKNPAYKHVTKDIVLYLSEKLHELRKIGVNDVVVDPGFGFGKTIDHNYQLLKELEYFSILRAPLLVGISRKSMIYKTLDIKAEDSLTATTALNLQALMGGADILRVHDVKAAREVVTLYDKLK